MPILVFSALAALVVNSQNYITIESGFFASLKSRTEMHISKMTADVGERANRFFSMSSIASSISF